MRVFLEREEFNLRAFIMASFPVYDILSKDRINLMRVELDKSACAMVAAPVSPITL